MIVGVRSFLVQIALALVLSPGCSGSRLFDRGARKSNGPTVSKRHRPGAPADLAATDASAGGTVAGAEPAEPVDVLFINEGSITVDDVLAPVRAELTAKASAMPPDRYRRTATELLGDRIRTMARELLLYQEASRRLTEQENKYLDTFTDQRIRDVVQREHQGRQVRWERAMAEQGLTPQQARQRLRRDLVILRHLQQTVTPRIQEPTRQELVRYFQERKDEMSQPERREMFLIEVHKGDDAEQARQTIEQALAELQDGAEFDAVARDHSAGIHAADGGSWGMVDPTSIRGRWAAAAQVVTELPAGGSSGIVEGDASFFIVRLGRVESSAEPDFSQVQLQLIEAYRDRQFNVLVDELVSRLQERATIRPANLNLFLQAAVNASLEPPSNAPPY